MIPVVAPKMLPFEKIIQDGENGFITSSDDEWINKTEQIIDNASLRKDIGNNAFKAVWESSKLISYSENLASSKAFLPLLYDLILFIFHFGSLSGKTSVPTFMSGLLFLE